MEYPKLTPKHVEVYANDCKVRYHPPPSVVPGVPAKAKRKNVLEFTYKSRSRLAFVASNSGVIFLSMITLTYPKEFPTNGSEVKRHFRAFQKRIKRRFNSPSYLWFLEFQARGAPHYHLLLSVPVTNADAYWTLDCWDNIVKSGDRNHKYAGTRTEMLRKPGPGSRYAVKYAMKMRQKTCPAIYTNVGRFWGHSRDVKPIQVMKNIPVRTLTELRQLARDWPYVHKLHDKCLGTLYGASADLGNTYLVDNLENLD